MKPTAHGRIRLLVLMFVALHALHALDGAAAAPWQPQYAHPPDSRSQYAHPPESQPQYAHPPESPPQYAHPPELQPQYAHPPESQPQYAHPPESQPQYAHPPESQPQYAHPPETPSPQPTRRPMYRRTVPSLPGFLRHQDGHQDGGAAKPSPSGYVVEGRNYRKYRVEEKTPDGFIVGEYGVVSHQDGSLRGVRYTADSTINPRLIYDALVKFLSL
ncbi:MAGE-like protein 2 [Thrips palmi]|uniref:MAGE-like protein 2 n=1 Tax=Thrips palmi TaxID=161013 RepID=A0A6P8Z4Q3_THRPL|nr:MAGE-like protein 2 [Thrips palmi]